MCIVTPRAIRKQTVHKGAGKNEIGKLTWNTKNVQITQRKAEKGRQEQTNKTEKNKE